MMEKTFDAAAARHLAAARDLLPRIDDAESRERLAGDLAGLDRAILRYGAGW